jgi:hypothetical protein
MERFSVLWRMSEEIKAEGQTRMLLAQLRHNRDYHTTTTDAERMPLNRGMALSPQGNQSAIFVLFSRVTVSGFGLTMTAHYLKFRPTPPLWPLSGAPTGPFAA